METKKLSLVAQFDDLCRLRASLMDEDRIDEQMIVFLRNQDECRRRWLDERNKLIVTETELKNENQTRRCLETTLKNVRYALRKEIQEKDAFRKEINFYRGNMKMAKNYLMDYKSNNSEAAKEKVLSYLNINNLEPLEERNDSSENSISDLDYDKTDDDIIEAPAVKFIGKRRSNDLKEDIHFKRTKSDEFVIVGEEAKENVEKLQAEADLRKTPLKSDSEIGFKFTPELKNIQSTPILKRLSTVSECITPQDMSLTNTTTRMESRQHTFALKKVFRPGEKCGPCGGNIGFCASCYRCQECRAICHVDCKSKVPLPCIPYVSKNQGVKVGRLLLISDFAPLNTRPCIPALIVHCCMEIEKRGLEEAGLYRVPGSDKDVRELKEKILNSKSGIPVLSNVDIHVLCGVVKSFLRSLDESLITRTLWRDFVKAADLEQDEDKKSYLYQAIGELPQANRDTLAYIIVHLQRISVSAACRMPKSNLAKVFGPTIVGYSMLNPPPMTLMGESPKQVSVMEALLDIPAEYWDHFLTQYSNSSTPQSSIGRNSRLSNGFRINGASVSTGILTPLRYNPKIQNKTPKLKPLF
ncbi:rac GTPase-activating protein 1-like protein [Leptotrombidium deliense]|uniref:Rac GTPase-activating protein 1-like protein n=1 Tax=Leptotrombidium deliense TaxID=299467 RepID=A0A443STU8_9ACAR|nr:rac GTPase-activating protein 1-like protein [Leptotrombidium deliense]